MTERRSSSVVEVQRQDDGVIRVKDDFLRKISQSNIHAADEIAEAREAREKEGSLTVRDALKLYPKAIMFSIIFSTAVIMEGYDLSLMGSFFGFPPFKNRYGTAPDPEVSEQIGYKKTMFGSLVLMIAFLFLPFFATNIQTILAGSILCGMPWGVFQTLTVAYASDVTPIVLRPYLTSYVNLCWVIGQFIAAGVLRGFLEVDSQWAYRVPFAIQWIWPVILLGGVGFAPESPWWLVRKGRLEDAKKSLLSLARPSSGVPFDADAQVAMIHATNELEIAISGGTSYFDCFRGTDLRRTQIACITWVTQAFCGAALMGYSVQFYERAGLDSKNSFNFNLGQYAMGAVGTVGSWFIMRVVGRRTLYLYGLAIMLVLLLVVGGLGCSNNKGAGWGVGSLLLVYTFVYDITVGPVCYSIVAEIPSTRLKIKTVGLARNLYNIGGIINNILMPRMLLVNEWNWGAKTGFFWAGACALLLTWTYFCLPEPKDRSYGELDVLFENHVSARKFATTKVDQFAGDHTEIVDNAGLENEKAAASLVELPSRTMPAVVFGLNAAAKKSTAGGVPKPAPSKRKAAFDAEDAASDDESPAFANLVSVAEVDASVYDYDGAYDSFSSAAAKKKQTAATATGAAEGSAAGPKYMSNLLASSEQRKRDQLRAREKALLRERDKEGDEFADKDKFVTSAYKKQQEEIRGAHIVVNDDGEVVDKRQLLSAGLNVAPKQPARNAAAAAAGSAHGRTAQGESSRLSHSRNAREAQRERQTRMMERQLEEIADKAEQAAKAEDRELQEKTKSKITDEAKMDAKARYLARKKEREEAAAAAKKSATAA
ncbi:hypothetical protein DV738_g1209, partial [Chaetothyriales sp. CBS 135597]